MTIRYKIGNIILATLASFFSYSISIIVGIIIYYFFMKIAPLVPKISPLISILSSGIMWVFSFVLAPVTAISSFYFLSHKKGFLINIIVATIWSVVIILFCLLDISKGNYGTYFNHFSALYSIFVLFITAILLQQDNHKIVNHIHSLSNFIYLLCLPLGFIIHLWTVYIAYNRDGIIWAFFAIGIPAGAETWYFLEIWKDIGKLNTYGNSLLTFIIIIVSSMVINYISEFK